MPTSVRDALRVVNNAPSVAGKDPPPLIVFEQADRDAKDFIAERIEHAMAHLDYAGRITNLTGDNISMLHEALSRAGMEFKAIRETMSDILARRKLGARDKVPG